MQDAEPPETPPDPTSLSERVRVLEVKVLSDHWSTLRTTTFDFRRRDGRWQTQHRETYDRGNGAAILLYQPLQRTVVLTRQFRYPTFVSGHRELMIEVPAGVLDGASPEDCIRAEAAQEAGVRVRAPRKVFEAFMSPGSVTERLHFFVAEYEPADRLGPGGGLEHEGEDIEVFEAGIDDAMKMIDTGEICDGKTIMLLQYAALHLFGGTGSH
jgi:nudix-type nucleoside diphosphatase (YffH/AdpP family)